MITFTIGEDDMKKKGINNYQKWALFFTLPNIILFIVFFVFPAVLGIYYSFTNYNGLGRMDFIGLENYIKLFQDKTFYKVLFRTISYVLITVPLVYLTALVAALLMTTKTVKCKTILRVSIYWPTLLSTIMVGLTWRWIFGENFGIINYLLMQIGMNPIGWGTTPTAAFLTTIIAEVWCNAGFFMMIFIGALENIPEELYEAGAIDGTNNWERFRYITLPQLKPTSFMIIVLTTINMFKVFASVVTLTGGGPGNSTTYMIQYIYQTGFEKMKIGYASAGSMVLFTILLLLSLVQMYINNKQGEGDL